MSSAERYAKKRRSVLGSQMAYADVGAGEPIVLALRHGRTSVVQGQIRVAFADANSTPLRAHRLARSTCASSNR